MGPHEPQVFAFCRCRFAGFAALAPVAPVIVSSLRRHGLGAAGGHTQPGDDRGAACQCHLGLGDDLHSFAVCAISGADRLSLRQPPLRIGLAPGALHLDGHLAAIWRPGGDAVCPVGAVGLGPSQPSTGLGRPNGCGRGVFAGGCWLAHHPNRGPGLGHRFGPGRRPTQSGGPDVRDAVAGHHRQCLGVWRCVGRLFARALGAGDPSLCGVDLGAQCDRLVEARGARSPPQARRHAHHLPIRLGHPQPLGARRAPLGRGGIWHHGLQHGRGVARTLWR